MANFQKHGQNVNGQVLKAPGAKAYELGLWGPIDTRTMAETGGGKYCFNWNLGNVKASANEPHMYLRNVWECDSQAGAEAQVARANGLARIATADEIKNHGWKCPHAVVVFDPPHPQCRFRAYSALQDGSQRWLSHHKAIARGMPDFV